MPTKAYTLDELLDMRIGKADGSTTGTLRFFAQQHCPEAGLFVSANGSTNGHAAESDVKTLFKHIANLGASKPGQSISTEEDDATASSASDDASASVAGVTSSLGNLHVSSRSGGGGAYSIEDLQAMSVGAKVKPKRGTLRYFAQSLCVGEGLFEDVNARECPTGADLPDQSQLDVLLAVMNNHVKAANAKPKTAAANGRIMRINGVEYDLDPPDSVTWDGIKHIIASPKSRGKKGVLYAFRIEDIALMNELLAPLGKEAPKWLKEGVKLGQSENWSMAQVRHNNCYSKECVCYMSHSGQFSDVELAEQLAHHILRSTMGTNPPLACPNVKGVCKVGIHHEWFAPDHTNPGFSSVDKWRSFVLGVMDWLHNEGPSLFEAELHAAGRKLV